MTTDADQHAAAAEKDTIARLADRGEEAIRKLADLPGGQRALKAFNDLRDRVDDLSRRMRGVDELEARIEALERRVDALEGGPGSGGDIAAAAE